MDNGLKFSVCIPTYNMGGLIGDVINDVLGQSYANFEIIISDNNSQDDTEKIVKSFKDPRIRFFKNDTNVGYARNLQLCLERSGGDIIYLLSAKGRISRDALEKTYAAFMISEDIGAVTRPYYWYGKDLQTPVRAKERYAKEKDAVISIHDNIEAIIAVVKT